MYIVIRALGELKQKSAPSSLNARSATIKMGLPLGSRAPSFTVTDQTGNAVNLEDTHGQKRIVAFVEPGCQSCADAIEALNGILHIEKQFALLVIGNPDASKNQEYARERQALMPILTPAPDLAIGTYDVRGVPFAFLLDEDGFIRAKDFVRNLEHLQALMRSAFEATPTNEIGGSNG